MFICHRLFNDNKTRVETCYLTTAPSLDGVQYLTQFLFIFVQSNTFYNCFSIAVLRQNITAWGFFFEMTMISTSLKPNSYLTVVVHFFKQHDNLFSERFLFIFTTLQCGKFKFRTLRCCGSKMFSVTALPVGFIYRNLAMWLVEF